MSRRLTKAGLSGSKSQELIKPIHKGEIMAVTTASVIPLTPEELDDRRLAVEGTIGTMRIEGLETDETTKQILLRYVQGEISFGETSHLLHEYSATIL
jgi:hypothetical protein